nr:hypothetical protein BaRGS_002488 [Batillaria attramentaria]
MSPSVTVWPDSNVISEWNVTGRPWGESTSLSDNYAYDEDPTYLLWKERNDIMLQIMCPTIFILGNFGNIMIILVMRKMSSNASGFPLLFTAVAVNDLLLLYVVLLPLWVLLVSGYFIQGASEAACKMYVWMMYSLLTLSAWLLAAMTAQRSMSIVWPLKMRASRPRRQALVTVLILVIASFAFCSFSLWGATTEGVDGKQCWWRSEFDAKVAHVFYCIAAFLNTALPFAVIVVCNCLMIRAVKLHSARKQSDSQAVMVSRMTLTLIVVSLTFIVLTLPMYVMMIISDGVSERDFAFHFWGNFVTLLGLTNSAINFFLYIMTGSRFRQEAKNLFCKACNKASIRTTTVADETAQRTKSLDF